MAGTTPSRSRFQRPAPSSPQRNPMEPFGTAGAPAALSQTTVFASAFSLVSPRSAAVRKAPATWAPSRSFSVTRKGRSVKRRA